MKPIKDILSEIVKNLETVAINLGAMEAALDELGFVHASDIDKYTGVLSGPQTNAKHALANVRYMISKIPD